MAFASTEGGSLGLNINLAEVGTKTRKQLVQI